MFILPHLKGLTAGNIGSAVFKNASLDLKFADNKSLVDAVTGASLVTFTRASSGTYVDSAGVLQTAVTNLLLRSEEFNDAGAWTKVGTTVSANSITSPNGALTADTLVEDTSTGTHRCVAAPTIANTTVCTVSVYAKAAGRTHMRLSVSGGLAGELTANLSNGTVAASSGATNPTVQSVGDDWYRVSFTTAASTGTSAQVGLSCIQGTNTSSYTGDGTSGIYFWGAQLEQSSTVGEYVPTTSAINSAPRFDHNPTTGESLGLLVEEQRTNLLLRSEEFNDASWAKVGATVTANTGAAPDNATTADLFTRTTTGVSYATQTFTKTASAIQYTFSVFVKQSVGNFCALRVQGTYPSRVDVVFNLSSATISTAAAVFGSFTGPSASITPYANGWYRLTVTATSDAVVALQVLASFNSNGIVLDGTDSVSTSAGLLWGAQLEAGAFPTSYIPTTTAAATRSADVASITGTAFSGWYNASAGTTYTSAQIGYTVPGGSFPVVAAINDGTASNRLEYGYLTAALAGFGVVTGGVDQGSVFPPTTASIRNLIGAYQLNNGAASVNGGTVSTISTMSVPVVNQLTIGRAPSAGNPVNGHIRRLVYWGQRLPNNVLQAITQ